MRIYRRTYRDRTGRKRTALKWYVEFTTHDGAQKRLAGFADKGATSRLAGYLERLVAYRAGDAPLPMDLRKWLEEIPGRIHDRLVKVGLVDRRREAARADLAEHVEAYRKHLAAKGNTPDHVQRTATRVRKVIRGCGFRRWPDVQAEPVRNFLAELRGGPDGVSIRTANHYGTAVKMFSNWMVESGRANASRLAGLKPLNADVDVRRERRALTPDEIKVLLAVTAGEPERYGLDGPTRGLAYRLCLETGLRANECRTLTRESFDLGERPTVTVKAGYSKRRRRDTIPLRRETADLLADVLARTFAGQAVFPLPTRTAEMLRGDLKAARAAWIDSADTASERRSRRESDFLKAEDASGRVLDFHALRHTTATLLAAAGVAPKVLQSVMRHSTITLTMDSYAHVIEGAQAAAVECMPSFAASGGGK